MKLYVCSDIHGYFDEFKKALDEAGFEENNPEHLMVVCGDLFDRGDKSWEIMNYMNSISNKVLVRGNHEDLLLECIDRRYFLGHDVSNGTADTIMDLADAMFGYNKSRPFGVTCELIEGKVKKLVDSMVNYYETANHIFVHSFIPLNAENWRQAHQGDWEEARWGNPFRFAEQGFLPDKTLIFGHWHTSWARAKYEGKPEFGDGADFSPYYGDGFIAIDACTAHTGKVNVVVLEDELI